MGRLGQSDSFAEQSVLLDEPMTCSIVTASAMQIGIIRPERLKGKHNYPKTILDANEALKLNRFCMPKKHCQLLMKPFTNSKINSQPLTS